MRKVAYRWLVSPIIIILIGMLLSGTLLYKHWDFARLSYTKKEISNKEWGFLFDKYIVQNPSVEVFYGEEDAPIQVIAFISPNSSSFRYFKKNVFPALESEYINTGRVKFSIKQHISVEDINEASERFKYAQTIACVKKVKPEVYFEFYFDLEHSDVLTLLDKYKVSNKEHRYCLENQATDLIRDDVLDVELFGMRGIEPRFYIGFGKNDYKTIEGVPDYTIFKRTIKSYQLLLGD